LVRRRAFLAGAPLLLAPLRSLAAKVAYPEVVRGRTLAFPRDHGAHPEFRIEWWYVTGWLQAAGTPLGFQVTFFRARPEEQDANPSRFAPRQVLVAHAALADPALGRLLHDQRAARDALELAGAATEGTRVWVDDWSLALEGGAYRSRIAARDFALELEFAPSGEVLAQGEAGFSRKGHRPHEASYYYSRPHLAVRGSVARKGGRLEVRGRAWLDHEWSSAYLAPEAAGWDWAGINLENGAALMAFRMRARAGGTHYAGGTLRSAGGSVRAFAPGEIVFEPVRTWRSPRTGVSYPVEMKLAAGKSEWRLAPLMDDQELDARASTGTIYWEGATRALQGGREAGRGYLELTGYWRAMTL
jgi:predicted secreted hydrolase